MLLTKLPSLIVPSCKRRWFLKKSSTFVPFFLACNLDREILKCDTEPTCWDFAFSAFYSSPKFQSFVVSTKLLKAFQPEWSFEHERCCCQGKQTKIIWQTCISLCSAEGICVKEKLSYLPVKEFWEWVVNEQRQSICLQSINFSLINGTQVYFG